MEVGIEAIRGTHCSFTQQSAGAAAELALTGSSHIILQQEFTLTGTALLNLSYDSQQW
jgi:hypothetical protein